MDVDLLRRLLVEGRSVRSMAADLGCSYTNVRYWIARLGLERTELVLPDRADCVCTECGRAFVWKRATGVQSRRRCNSCHTNRRRFVLRAKIVEYLGGCCSRCGYAVCSGALHAHHVDSTEKDFNISGAHSRSWASVLAELKKCVLLCANCHAEVHHDCEKYSCAG